MNLHPETQIYLKKYKPRPYQLDFVLDFEAKKHKKYILIWGRRAGKDLTVWNLLIREAIRIPAVYFMLYPTYAQGKKIIFDSITNDGVRFIDFIPKEIIKSVNSQELKISLINGSIINIVGTDNVDRLVGTNPRGLVYSEAALQDQKSYTMLRPILAANDGWVIFISTPRGKNWFWEMYQIALNNPDDWYTSLLTLDDTKHIPYHQIEKDMSEGLMSYDLMRQEYFCDFSLGVEGSYYAKYLDKMKISGQIGQVPWEAAFKVSTCWDIGVRDSTSIIFFQNVGQIVRIIDYYENSKEGLEHYVQILEKKPYSYGKHIAPHDIAVKEWGSGLTRIEKAKQLGVKFTLAPAISIEDGIETVRSSFSKMWIDEKNCVQLVKCLENYRQEYDDKRKVYKPIPLHNFASHGADAFRYLCISLPKIRDGLSAEELDKRYREVVYGEQGKLPSFFRENF
jgi:hypothetical protein